MYTRLFGDLLQEVRSSGEENLLSIYNKHWSEFSEGSSYLNQLFGWVTAVIAFKTKSLNTVFFPVASDNATCDSYVRVCDREIMLNNC